MTNEQLTNITICAIVPVYNVERFLERCLDSILRQTRPFDQIVLVDDGSTDTSGALCDVYAAMDVRVTVIHQANAGLSAARNTGIAHNVCTHVTFIDSDDWLAPTFVESMRELVKKTGCDLAVCGYCRVKSKKEFDGKWNIPMSTAVYSSDRWLRLLLRFEGNRALHYAWGKLYSACCLETDLFPVGMLNEDVEGAFRVALRVNSVAETTVPLYAYFINNESITGKSFGENYLCLNEVWHRVKLIAQTERPALLPMVEYNEKRTNFTVLCDALIHGNEHTDKLYASQLDERQRALKDDLPVLLDGPMDVRRKLAAWAFGHFWNQFRMLYRLIRK